MHIHNLIGGWKIKMSESLIKMLYTLSLSDLILIGNLNIFNKGCWGPYWENANVEVIFIYLLNRRYLYKTD